MSLRQMCHCGHEKATHYADEYGDGCCLGILCECQGYLNEHTRKPAKQEFKAAERWQDDFEDPLDEAPATWPAFPAAPKAWP